MPKDPSLYTIYQIGKIREYVNYIVVKRYKEPLDSILLDLASPNITSNKHFTILVDNIIRME